MHADKKGFIGTTAPGPVRGTDKLKTKPEYLQAMTEMTKSGLVDIMLMSASSAEALHEKKLFAKSKVTPAVRLNDTTDIWSQRSGDYKADFSQPFRTARPDKAKRVSDLGLYSVTFSNDVESARCGDATAAGRGNHGAAAGSVAADTMS